MLESRRLLTAGELDLTFGIGGKVLTDIGNGAHNSGSGVAAYQSDGKVIMNGYMSGVGDNNIDFGVVRYNSNGSLDTSFGVNGVVSVDFGGIGDLGFGIAVDSNDRIIVVGSSLQGATLVDFAVARLMLLVATLVGR